MGANGENINADELICNYANDIAIQELEAIDFSANPDIIVECNRIKTIIETKTQHPVCGNDLCENIGLVKQIGLSALVDENDSTCHLVSNSCGDHEDRRELGHFCNIL